MSKSNNKPRKTGLSAIAHCKDKIKIRSKIKAPPTKVFIDKKKENEKRKCRTPLYEIRMKRIGQNNKPPKV